MMTTTEAVRERRLRRLAGKDGNTFRKLRKPVLEGGMQVMYMEADDHNQHRRDVGIARRRRSGLCREVTSPAPEQSTDVQVIGGGIPASVGREMKAAVADVVSIRNSHEATPPNWRSRCQSITNSTRRKSTTRSTST